MREVTIGISGYRELSNTKLIHNTLSLIREDLESKGFRVVKFIHGDCRGADKIGEAWAENNGIETHAFPADWTKYGKPAGMIRNQEMAPHAHFWICFNHPLSKGTKAMINFLEKSNIKYIEIMTTDEWVH